MEPMEIWLRESVKSVTIYDLEYLPVSLFQRTLLMPFKKDGIHPFDKNIFTGENFSPSAVTYRFNPNVLQNPLDVSLQDISDNEGKNIFLLLP